VRAIFDGLAHDRIVGYHENEWRMKDGSRRLFAWHNTVLRDKKGDVTHIVALGDDISERRASEERIRRDAEQQATLRGLLETILAGGVLEDTLLRCLDQVLAVSWLSLLPKGAIFLMEDGGGNLRMAVSRNLEPQVVTSCGRLTLGHCLCGRVAATGMPLHVAHVDERHDTQYPGMEDHGHYVLPLVSAGGTVGVLVLYIPPGTGSDAAEERFLSSVAGILAAFIERSWAESELANYRTGLEDRVKQRTAELSLSEARTRAILRSKIGRAHV
jgi:PAS domain-containing protein